MIPLLSIHATLLSTYGPQGWWPINGKYDSSFKDRKKTPNEQFEIAVGAILTQNTAWTNVEKSLQSLKSANLLSPSAILKTPTDHLASIIRSSGYHNQKAKKLKELAKSDLTSPSREHLLDIWGIGPETADSILLDAYNHPTFVIDAYTKRIISRLGIIKKQQKDITYDELQEFFHNQLPTDYKLFNEYHALLVQHAKRYCKTSPQCEGCPLKNQCEYAADTQ